ncbi:MAG: DNA mismatch repair endonuclease MutL [Ruminococcaceae bacterium]|nr:DNA mismatch repair endonuclease MutL [Oscillospiraceae bacterium]
MPHIQQLSPHVADLIAAGEVVERPASVAKELLENALDAGASAVTIEIKDGGMTYLRVSDDGCGIAADELPTAFLRHATSKLRTAEDLSAIGTLGFRGEALAAISAVSRLDVLTRERGALTGASLHLEGGVPGEVADAGCPEGTSVIVRDLFYNTPARLKFMKRDSAEATAISGLVTHLALSHPGVSFRLLRDGAEALHTPGDGALKSAVYAALGRDFTLSLVEVAGRDGALAADGFVTRPLNGRGSRAMQTFFVNGRLVKSQLLTAALEEAYANRIMKGRFPGCVLSVTLPFDMVDVNVHPAKTIVKFVNDKQVFDLVYHAVMDVLDREAKPEGALPKAPAQAAQGARDGFYQTMTAEQFRAQHTAQGGKAAAAAPAAKPQSAAAKTAEPESAPVFHTRVPAVTLGESGGRARVSDVVPRGGTFSASDALREPAAPAPEPEIAPLPAVSVIPAGPEAAPEPASAPEPEQTTLLPEETVPWRIAGEVLDTYIVCEDADKNVWLIDKHAAHERVNFDRYKAQDAPVMSQTLLTPLVAQLGAAEHAAVCAEADALRACGFECEDFGGGAVLLRCVPADIDVSDAVGTLEELAAALADGKSADHAGARDALLATLACKAAIKGGWKSDERELRALVDRVQSGEIEYCPHGRPVKVRLTQREIEKMFKRVT